MEKKDYLLLAVAIAVMLYGFILISQAPMPAQQPTYEDDLSGELVDDVEPADDVDPIVAADDPAPPPIPEDDTEPAPPTPPPPAPAGDLLPRFAELTPADAIIHESELATYHFAPETGGLATVVLKDLDMTLGTESMPMFTIEPVEGRWEFSHARIAEQTPTSFVIERQVRGRPLIVEQRYTLETGPYQMRCQIVMRNAGDAPVEVEAWRLLTGVVADLGTPKGFMGSAGVGQRIDILHVGEDDPETLTLDKLQKQDAEERTELLTTDAQWLAVQNKYFATIISGELPFRGVSGGAAKQLLLAVSPQPAADNPSLYRGVLVRTGDASASLTVNLSASDAQAVAVPNRLRFAQFASSMTFRVNLAEGEELPALTETTLTATAPGHIGGTAPVYDPTLQNPSDFEMPDPHIIGFTYMQGTILEPGEIAKHELDIYTGPKRYDRLAELGGNKESLMQFDLFLFFHFTWFKYISLGILWLLTTFHGLTGSYGIAILFITLILRLLFWPITHQSTVMSRKMQAIQPLAKELREKYKNDPRKMQEKTMELYRQHKVNPISGCLPALLQIPAFFALFNVLRNAVELRHASFLWATDLALPDTIGHILGLPINPLALLMGTSMVLQMKLVPTSADPSQQRMMMIMSGMFIIFLYTMPSGLTLYWTANQILNIIQYRITHKHMDKKEAEAAATT